MGKYYDKEKNQGVIYKVGNLVFLNSKNLMIQRPMKKFNHKMLGLVTTTNVISPMVVKLQVPESWIIYTICYVNLRLLYRYHSGQPRLKLRVIPNETGKLH
jgi:hypothetical protein